MKKNITLVFFSLFFYIAFSFQRYAQSLGHHDQAFKTQNFIIDNTLLLNDQQESSPAFLLPNITSSQFTDEFFKIVFTRNSKYLVPKGPDDPHTYIQNDLKADYAGSIVTKKILKPAKPCKRCKKSRHFLKTHKIISRITNYCEITLKSFTSLSFFNSLPGSKKELFFYVDFLKRMYRINSYSIRPPPFL